MWWKSKKDSVRVLWSISVSGRYIRILESYYEWPLFFMLGLNTLIMSFTGARVGHRDCVCYFCLVSFPKFWCVDSCKIFGHERCRQIWFVHRGHNNPSFLQHFAWPVDHGFQFTYSGVRVRMAIRILLRYNDVTCIENLAGSDTVASGTCCHWGRARCFYFS